MQVYSIKSIPTGSEIFPCGTKLDVLAIWGRKRRFHGRNLKKNYLLVLPDYDIAEWYPSEWFTIIDDRRPGYWIAMDYKKNKVVKPNDFELPTVSYSYYEGPEMLISPERNLTIITDGDRKLTEQLLLYTQGKYTPPEEEILD